MSRADPRPIGIASLPDGTRVTVRPACARDADRIQHFVRGLSPASRYDRFLAPMNELSPGELARIGAGAARQATLIAETKIAAARIMIGEARYAAADGVTEIALSVAEAWRGRGLGTLLMDDLECRARNLGANMLVGDVLRSNAAMRTLARKSGFDQAGVPADARLVRIVKDISTARVGMPCGQFATSGVLMAA